MRFLLYLSIAGLSLASSIRVEPDGKLSPPTHAFLSVDVVPMSTGEPVLRDQTVLVRGGRIAQIGPSRTVRVPRGSIRIDGRGRYLLPGLADMHVHLEHFDNPAYLKLFLVNGVTTVRNMDGRPHILDWKRQTAAGELDSPRIFTAGQVLDGSPPVRDDNIALATPEQARAAVERQAAAGYDYIKVYTNLAPEVFKAIMAAARTRSVPVVGHAPRAVGLDAFLASGVRSVEHLGDFGDAIAGSPGPATSLPPVLRRRLGFPVDPARMQALAARLAESGSSVVPTMITDERTLASPAEVERWAKAPEIASIDRGIVEYWRGAVTRAAGRVEPDQWRWVEQGRANQRALVRGFFQAGVPMLLGTDTPQPFVFPGASVHDELANYVAAGLTPAQALALATREPARFVGKDDRWGTIEAGRRADLLLLDANPLADIAATRRIAGVMAGGRWLPPNELRRMRREVEQIAAASE